MLKFEQDRVLITNLNTTKFKHTIPVLCVKPKLESNDSVIFIFNGGIGNSIPSCLYLSNFAYDKNYFITYEKAGHNNNKNKPSQFKKLYLNELDTVVDWTKKQYPNKKIYLLGESWGTSVNFIYYKTHKNKVNGAIGWNMPFSITNPEHRRGKQMYSIVWRELLTLLFNVECHLPVVQGSQDKFSRDPLFARLLNLVPPSKTNTKINLAVWRYMRPARQFLKKYGSNPEYNFLYIQSGEDVMVNHKKLKKLEKKMDDKHYIKFPTGYHVLSLEPKESIDLFNLILEYVKK